MSTYAHNFIGSKELSQTLRHMRIGISYNDALNELSAWWPPPKRGLPPFATYKIKLFWLHSWVYESQSEWKQQWQEKIWKVGYLQIPILDKISSPYWDIYIHFALWGLKNIINHTRVQGTSQIWYPDQPLHQCPIIPFSDKPIFGRGKKKKKKKKYIIIFFIFRKFCSYFSFYARDKLGVLSGLPSWPFLCQLSQIWHIVKWLAVKKITCWLFSLKNHEKKK